MKNIDIVRGYRSFGHEDLYASDPTVAVQPGDIITMDGKKATLTDTHIECGVAVESNVNPMGGQKPSGKIPVYVSNFVVRFYSPAPEGVNLGDPVTVIDGKVAPLDDTHKVVWGYVTKITDTSYDVRVNY
jgi:hypothetical protein